MARVAEEHAEPTSYVTHTARDAEPASAVTISIAKRKGANAARVADAVLERVEQARGPESNRTPSSSTPDRVRQAQGWPSLSGHRGQRCRL